MLHPQRINQSQTVKKEKPLWSYDIEEISGHIIEAKGRDEVNKLLEEGWMLLHIYTLRFKEQDGVWRERPMAILGRPKHIQPREDKIH